MTNIRILFIHHGALGDIVSTFPALLRLKKDCDHIAILCQSSIGRLAAALEVVDHSFPLEAAAFSTLYSNHIDPAVKDILRSFHKIILVSRFRSIERTLLSITGNAVHRIQPRPSKGQKIHVTQHIVSNFINYKLFEPRNEETDPILSSILHTDRRDLRYDPVKIFIHPGSGSRKKCWPVSNFIEIAWSLDANGRRPEFIFGPAEHDLFKNLSRQNIPNAKVHPIDKLTELAFLLKTGGGFIGNDSGVSHLAAFIGLPTVAVFGPSDPEIWKPMGRAVKIVRPDVACSPCFETGKIECDEVECLNRISPKDVLAAFYSAY